MLADVLRQWNDRYSLPDAENDLVPGLLGLWEDVLRGVTLVGRVGTDDLLSSACDGLEVESPVVCVLASSIWLLVSESESELAVSSGNDSWSSNGKSGGNSRELHDESILSIYYGSVVKECRFLAA